MKRPIEVRLDSRTYLWLKSNKKYKPADDNWFKESYKVFVNKRAPKTIEEFYELVAFAYAWMPTIPNVKLISKSKWKKINKGLSTLDNSSEKDLTNVLKILVPIVNNSIVGVSKILHFISPTAMPIIDSRVLRAWKKIFKGNKALYLRSNLLVKNNLIKVIENYLQYRRYLLEWQTNCRGVSIRDLESTLYYQL